jgi:hypothetical protein
VVWQKSKKRKRGDSYKPSMLDDEAAESGEEDMEGEDDEEGDEDLNEYRIDDFLVADEGEGEEGSSDEGDEEGRKERCVRGAAQLQRTGCWRWC